MNLANNPCRLFNAIKGNVRNKKDKYHRRIVKAVRIMSIVILSNAGKSFLMSLMDMQG